MPLPHALQVCFADILEVEGKATEEEFRKEYGADRVCFVKCDVRKQEDLHSESEIDGGVFFYRCLSTPSHYLNNVD